MNHLKLSQRRISLCPACATPFLEKVEKVGLEGKTMFVHKIESATSLGVRASGCIVQKEASCLLQFAPGVEDKPLLVPAKLDVANIMQLDREMRVHETAG